MLLGLVAAACSSQTPTTPTPTPTPTPLATPTRIIQLGGTLDFGDVIVGQVRGDGRLTITNNGNSPLTVTSITGPCRATAVTTSFPNGTIAPGTTQNATIQFAPMTVANCSGVYTVNSDQTSGLNTITVVANGIAAAVRTMTGIWVGSWNVYLFTMTLTQTGTIVTGTYLDQDGTGRTDPAQPGSFNDPTIVVRMKQAPFGDFTFTGTMNSTAQTLSGTVIVESEEGRCDSCSRFQSFTMTRR